MSNYKEIGIVSKDLFFHIESNLVEEQQKLLTDTTDTVEKCKINYQYGKKFLKHKMNPKALKCFEVIILESSKDIKPVGVDKYAYKAHQRVSKLYYDMLCFKTAKTHLEKAEEIILQLESNA